MKFALLTLLASLLGALRFYILTVRQHMWDLHVADAMNINRNEM